MIVLITGGGSGLGKIIGEQLIKRNHHIFVFDKLPISKINPDYLKLINYYELDIYNLSTLKQLIENITDKYGRIDVLINNAALRDFKAFNDFNEISINNNVKVNFEIPILLTWFLLPIMQKNNFGRIVNISSISGLQGYRSGSLYCSTKSALMIFTEALAEDLIILNKNITANAILPDSFQTREGEKLKSYDYITKKIVKIIFRIINSNINRKIFVISPPLKKAKEFIKIVYTDFKRFYK